MDKKLHHAAAKIAPALLVWHAESGRHDLPWQRQGPYAVWLSEVMLQQTQVQTVIPYYLRFIARFPTVADLAAAPHDVVMALWSGLGYYSRARNLHQAAQKVMRDFKGQFPHQADLLETLPGVGRSTAAAIAAFCFQERVAICDANVKRVLSRYYGVTFNPELATAQAQARLWQLAQDSLPLEPEAMPAYTQAIMDLGALCCTARKPVCALCPLRADCAQHQSSCTAPFLIAEPMPNYQHDAPPRRRKKARVQLTLHWLLVRNAAGAVCVLRRPAPGIWAGLYCVPTLCSDLEVEQFAQTWAEHCGVAVSARKFTQVQQTLTHRDLEIHVWDLPWPAQSPAQRNSALDCPVKDGQWLSLEALLSLGLPAALRRILPLWQEQCVKA